MKATAQLRFGDMFSGPSDLVVVPCSTGPTISGSVRERLQAFQLPEPTDRLHLGEVQFKRLGGAQNIASWIAFAASVKSYNSTAQAIEQIGRALGRFARDNAEVRMISTPLLGASAGGLSPRTVVTALKQGFLEHAPDNAVLNIFVLHQTLFDELVRAIESNPQANVAPTPAASVPNTRPAVRTPVRVLISYTRTDPAHSAWVERLGTRLRHDGIDARLDVWHLRPGMDVAQWMCNELDLAERVLLICNAEYARRADGRHGGVGWETRLVQGDLLMNQNNNPDKYIPIVRTRQPEDGLPAFLRTTYYLHWPPDGPEESLSIEIVNVLYRRAKEAPPLGQPPAHVLA